MPKVDAPDRDGPAGGGPERLGSGKLLLDEPVPGVARLTISNPKRRNALERELVELRESCFGSEDFREGVTAFARKRAPEWKGR